MKRIKGVRKATHKLIILAVKDYYTEHNWNVVKYINGEKIEITETEKADARKIKNNLLDNIYTENLLSECP